ncbi:hypothetical protein [uncultured Nostoc sp.]|uniref:hypothetical protein n=1 Tax=uncultured Nostoc sp. TaxID=340711 RepID=UPI0035CACEC9
MAKLVFLKILGGDFNSGFLVNMQIYNEHDRLLIADIEGKLPPAKDLPDHYAKWQACYSQIVSQRNPRLSVKNTSVRSTEIIAEIKKAKENLHFHINDWLKPEGSFIPIWTAILTHLKNEDEEIRVIFKTDNFQLRRLPLCVWEQFFEERYHRSEIAIYLPPVQSIRLKNSISRVKVLAVLGSTEISSNTTQLRIDKDWEMLKKFLSSESNAEVISLPEPNLEQLADTLDEQRPQILFFAGHSHTENEENIGRIVIIGTPGYAPAEQMQGNPKINSDIYALGMIAIHALTGILPFQLNQSYTGEIDWHNQANINPKLKKIIDKMVCFDFSQRYQSATEVLKDLDVLTNRSKNTNILTILKTLLVSNKRGFKIIQNKSNVFTIEFNWIQVLCIILIIVLAVLGWVKFTEKESPPQHKLPRLEQK